MVINVNNYHVGYACIIVECFVSFLSQRNPNSLGLPNWPAYQATDRPFMKFNDTSGSENHVFADRMQFWLNDVQKLNRANTISFHINNAMIGKK